MDKLRPIDKFSLGYVKSLYSYQDYIAEKELKTNQAVLPSEGDSDIELDDGVLSVDSEDDNKINKMDMEAAYKIYLSKKQEIMKAYEENDENIEE